MPTAKRFLPTALLCAALAAGATACGTGSAGHVAASPGERGVSPVPGTPLAAPSANALPSLSPDHYFASLSPDEISQQMQTAMAAVTSLRMTGTVTTNGQTATMDLAANLNGDCQGTISTASLGQVELRHTAGQTWMQPDATFWRSIAAKQGHPQNGDRAAELFKGRYLTGPADDPSLKQMADACAFVGTLAQSPSDNLTLGKGTLSVIDGVSVISLAGEDTSGTATALYVAAVAPHHLIRISGEGGGDPQSVDLSDFDKPVTVQAPPADQVIDISQFQQQLKTA
ncbi:hypothetical protein [Kitasatospora sp. GAS1066B]|uniref:hypothetical protein n=1 Tax=Kitasatospora sp. GAS1066B TaxID=3156271 RepID=UPI00351900BA